MESEKDLRDQIENITTTSFQIAGCKIKTFKRFLKFCEVHSTVTKVFWRNIVSRAPNGAKVYTKKKEIKEEINYAIGLDRLLDIQEADAKTQMLYDRIVALENKVELSGSTQTDRSPKTFGLKMVKKQEVDEDVKTK